MDKNAITLLEVLIVIVIIAILAAIAVPNFTGKIERTRTERAIAVTELIASAYAQYYRVTHETDPVPLPTTLQQINTTFNLELSDPNFSYGISWNDPLTILRIVITRNGTTQYIIYNLRSTDGTTPEGFDHSTSTWHPEWLP